MSVSKTATGVNQPFAARHRYGIAFPRFGRRVTVKATGRPPTAENQGIVAAAQVQPVCAIAKETPRQTFPNRQPCERSAAFTPPEKGVLQ